MKRHVYADNAATSRLSDKALEAMLPWLKDEYGNASQPYSFSRKPKKAVVDAKAQIAECIGALPEEIFITSGGTESNNWVIKNTCLNDPRRNGIITSEIEHHAVLNACKFEKEYRGRRITMIPVSAEATVDVQEFSRMITDMDGLVSIMLANNEVGTIEPIQQLCEIAHARGLLFHTDAVQAVGHIPIDVKKFGVDFLSASAHKFNGPKGIGFLYAKRGAILMPYMSGGSQEMGMRAGTENVAAIVGMAAALVENRDELSGVQTYLKKLEELLLTKLDAAGVNYERNGARVHMPGNISLSFRGYNGESIMHCLDLMGISVSTGSACDSQRAQVSHVLNAMHLDNGRARGTIRISLGKYNSEDDVETLAAALVKVLQVAKIK